MQILICQIFHDLCKWLDYWMLNQLIKCNLKNLIKMELDKREISLEQVQTLEEVILVLSSNFNEENIADEVNFLHIVRDNLKQWSNQ